MCGIVLQARRVDCVRDRLRGVRCVYGGVVDHDCGYLGYFGER